MTRKLVLLAVFAILTAITFVQFNTYDAWTAEMVLWGSSISVWIGATVIIVILGGVFLLFRMFEDQTPNWLIAVVSIAIIVCMLGGIFATANMDGDYRNTNSTNFRSYGTYYYIFHSRSSSSNSSSSSVVPSGSSKNAGAIVIAVIVVLLVIGSFVIPYFWVSAVIALLALLGVFVLKDVFATEDW